MANALIVQKDRLPLSQKALCAAQYVRMSTDYQKYSIENQAVVIAAFAQLHKLTIVRTYRDEGESGLQIKNRMGLMQLIKDVQSGSAEFGYVLVFDVSRWGRFQDVDESAHYEFICKQAGVKVAYCAEQFDNDGSLISHIMKNIKRVMAAEFSRELSAKVHAGQSHLARLGFKMGAPVGYGLQRLLVDEKSRPKAILKPGEWKSLTSDHVRVQTGTADQIAIVRWIFEEFLRVKSEEKIVRELNRRNVPTNTDRPWNRAKVVRLLKNETYIGNLVYNRQTQKLGTKTANNPSAVWIRTEGCVEPIIDRDLFLRVNEMRKGRRLELSEEEMLSRLRRVLMKKGKLSATVIDETVGLPHSSTYYRYFGTLRNAYRLIGYNDTRHWEALEAYNRWLAINADNAAQLRDRFEKTGAKATFDSPTACVRVYDSVGISFAVARWQRASREHQDPQWLLNCKGGRSPPGWIVALRLQKNNRTVLDHILLPSKSIKGTWLRFMDKTRERRKIEGFGTFEDLAQSLVRRVNRAKRSASNNPSRSKTSRSTQGDRPQRGCRRGTKHKNV